MGTMWDDEMGNATLIPMLRGMLFVWMLALAFNTSKQLTHWTLLPICHTNAIGMLHDGLARQT